MNRVPLYPKFYNKVDPKDLQVIASFNRIILNYLKMKELEKKLNL